MRAWSTPKFYFCLSQGQLLAFGLFSNRLRLILLLILISASSRQRVCGISLQTTGALSMNPHGWYEHIELLFENLGLNSSREKKWFSLHQFFVLDIYLHKTLIHGMCVHEEVSIHQPHSSLFFSLGLCVTTQSLYREAPALFINKSPKKEISAVSCTLLSTQYMIQP